jgi:hypothetical protein
LTLDNSGLIVLRKEKVEMRIWLYARRARPAAG